MLHLILTPHIGLIFWQTIIILVAYFLLRRFAWAPMLAFIEAQEAAQEEAATQTQQAEKKLKEAEMKSQRTLTQARAKRERLLSKAIATKQALLAEAQIEAETMRTKMVEKAHQEIAQEQKSALVAFKGAASTLVVHTAQKLIGQELQKKHVQQKVLAHMIDEAFQETAPQRTP